MVRDNDTARIELRRAIIDTMVGQAYYTAKEILDEQSLENKEGLGDTLKAQLTHADKSLLAAALGMQDEIELDQKINTAIQTFHFKEATYNIEAIIDPNYEGDEVNDYMAATRHLFLADKTIDEAFEALVESSSFNMAHVEEVRFECYGSLMHYARAKAEDCFSMALEGDAGGAYAAEGYRLVDLAMKFREWQSGGDNKMSLGEKMQKLKEKKAQVDNEIPTEPKESRLQESPRLNPDITASIGASELPRLTEGKVNTPRDTGGTLAAK